MRRTERVAERHGRGATMVGSRQGAVNGTKASPERANHDQTARRKVRFQRQAPYRSFVAGQTGLTPW